MQLLNKKDQTMGKGTTFIGQPVLNQVVNLMSKDKINILADEKGTDRYTKHLDSYTHLVIMLYAVLTNSSSLREVVLGFESNVSRMGHLGMDYLVRRSTLADANKRRAPAFFEAVYDYLYRLYEPVLSDSRTKRELLDKLYVMDSTTISLFSEILKGVGRNPENGKKKGGIKAHTIIKYDIDIPMMVDYTAAAVHDHEQMGKILSLPSGSYIAFDMGYVDYYLWEQMTESGIKYVTRQKDNAKYRVVETRKAEGKDILSDEVIEVDYDKEIERPITPEELSHRRGRRPKSGIIMVKERKKGVHRCRRIVKRTDDGKGTVAFITNDFDLSAEEVCELYRRRWSVETLYKKVKQNFPLKYFLGDNENAIKIQIWVTMIAYLLMKVLQHKSKSKLAFSNLVTTVRITICSYTDIVMLLNNPTVEWEAYQKRRREMLAANMEKYRQLNLFDDT